MSEFRDSAWRRRDVLMTGAALAMGWLGRDPRVYGEPAGSQPASQASRPVALPPPGAVFGRAVYGAEPPERKVIDCTADPHCALLYRKDPLLEEDLIVGAAGGLANVFVFVSGGLGDRARPAVPEAPVVLDQEGCRYIPRVFGMLAGQAIKIINSSKINEAPHGLSQRNEEFSFTLPKKGMSKTVVLKEPETFKIVCDVHPWEAAWCHVMSHPFFTVTDSAGQFVLPGLDPGEYELSFWHEHGSLTTQQASVRVERDRPVRVDDITFKPTSRRRPVAAP